MAKLVFTETTSSQLGKMPLLDGRLTWTTDTKCLYRDIADERIKLSSAAKVTIQQGAQEKGSFTLNQDENVTIQLTDYTLASFGVTASADELNKTSGLKSNAQAQIDDIVSGLLTQSEYTTLLEELEN